MAAVPDLFAKSHLFRRVREEDRLALIEQAKSVSLKSGDILYSEGQAAKTLYLITEGIILLSRKIRGKIVPCGQLSTGDFLGLECVSTNPIRSTTATAHESISLLGIDRSHLFRLAAQAPQFKITLKSALNIPREISPRIIAWLEPGEYLHYFGYRHPLFLFAGLFLPALLGIGSVFLFTSAVEMEQGFFTTVGVIGFLLALAWGVWNYLDYYNDFFAVTAKRVVWQEKIIGIYDSRQEAPVDAIRAIDYQASWIGRLLGYGTVYLRTFTGGVVLNRIENAQFVMDLIDEIHGRIVHEQVSEEKQTRRRVIREQMGLEKIQLVEQQESLPPTEKKRAAWEISFKTRMVEGDTVIFRKHWLILISKTIIPMGMFILSVIVAIRSALFPGWENTIPPQIGLSLGILLALASFLWAAYHYLDWRNDIYMVTAENVFDIERRPLGREEKKSAPLESILSLTVERKNLAGILFNYGDVIIDAGGTILSFHNICDPASAQLDIAARVDGIKRRKEKARTAAENQRLAEWIGEYYELTRG